MKRSYVIFVIALFVLSGSTGVSVAHSPVKQSSPLPGPPASDIGTTNKASDSLNPDPELVDVAVSDESITLGESVTVTITADNRGGDGGQSSTISASFPTLDEYDDDSQVSIQRNTLDNTNIETAGNTIHTNRGDSRTADYLLAEGTSGGSSWYGGNQNTLSLTVTPDSAGTFVIYVRATLTDDGDMSQHFTAPSVGDSEDQQGYAVKKITVDVTKPSESIAIFPENENDEVPHDPTILLVRQSDGESKSLPLDARGKCSECAWFRDGFVSPGDYMAYVKVDSNYWGWRHIHVSKDEDEYIVFDRGGVWESRSSVSGATTTDGLPRVAPGEPLSVTINTRKKHHGSQAKIKVYLHERGTSRPSNPTTSITRTPSEGSHSYRIDVPTTGFEAGEYELDYVLRTYFDEMGGYRTTDIVDGPTIKIAPYEPPSITDSSPGKHDLTITPSDSRTFSVTPTDPDTQQSNLDVNWYVDGTHTVSGTSFEFSPDSYEPGSHTVRVAVSDGSSRTDDVQRSWTISVIKPPRIESVEHEASSITAGKPVSFSVDATNPNGRTVTNYSWSIQGDHLVGRDVSYRFTETGTVSVTVTVTNPAGLSTSKTVRVSVEGAKPQIESFSPEERRVVVGTDVPFTVTARDPLGRNVSMKYRWRVDGETAFTTRSGTRSFSQVGAHQVAVRVSNEFGAVTEKTVTLNVVNDRPTVERMAPHTETPTVESEQTMRFVARVRNNDSSAVRAQLVVDGNVVSTKRVHQTVAKVSFETSFSTPGSHTVNMRVTDGHGVSNSLSWSVRVTSQEPVFDSWTPSPTSISGSTPANYTFSVNAHDPEGQSLSYAWYVNDNYVGDGARLSQHFPTHGTYDVRVEASDPQGVKASHSWTVDVDSFVVKPKLRKHATETSVRVDNGTTTFLSVALRNPKSNNRTMAVSFIVDLPDGLAIKRMANVKASSEGNAIGYATLKPGEQKSMRLGVFVKDERLAGTSVAIGYDVRYYPVGQKKDYHSVLNQSSSLQILGNDERDSSASTSATGSIGGRGSSGGAIPGVSFAGWVLALFVATFVLGVRND